MNQIQYVQRDCRDKEKIEKFLLESRIGIIGMNGDEFPYAVPVNFIWNDGSIFFHGMGSGKKETILSSGPPVCFTVYEEYGTVTDPVPCHADTAYMSVMLFGNVKKVVDFDEAALVLQNLVEKYTPRYYKHPLTAKLIERYKSSFDGNAVSIYRITPENMTAKENHAKEDKLFKRNDR
ncbi:pyridoxamine 5'-phosphate oxidase family protein [Methanobacterium sp.]|uniref:pyridoxamine 5'-phosphate oxidase family protein n=1 Tax=Methanobacterium sp. TaxID=2164 RepID=UPI003C76FE6C